MPKAKRFEDLEIFQKARDLCKEVYAITKKGEFHKDTRFVQQIHASAGSVMDNIAEGYERDGNKEFVNYLFKFLMLEKEEKQVREECSRPQRTAAAEAQFPFYFRRGAGRRGSNIKISEFLVKK